MRYVRVSVSWQVAICGCCLSPVWIAILHAPRFATGDYPYPNTCTEVGIRILSANKDLCRYKGMTLHPAPVPISHSTWYIGPPLAKPKRRDVLAWSIINTLHMKSLNMVKHCVLVILWYMWTKHHVVVLCRITNWSLIGTNSCQRCL